jgi:hypothetical protein
MSASCRGAELGLELEGVVVAQATDPQPISGDVALMAGLGESGELVVLFDDLEVRP